MPSMAFTPRRQAGFTLIELMITILVMAILLGIGLPSFQSTIKEQRVLTQSNAIVSSVAQARSEAMKRSKFVTVCPSADGATCGADWALGWIVFTEKDTVMVGDAPDVQDVLAVEAAGKGVQFTQAAGNHWMRFSSRGLAESAITLDVKPTQCDADTVYREIVFGITGRAVPSKKKC